MRSERGTAATAAVALAGLMSASGAASAADTQPVNPNEKGSINIRRFEQPATLGEAPDGTEQDADGLRPKVSEKDAKLADAKFAVYWTSTPVFSDSNRIKGLDGMVNDLLVLDSSGAFSAKGLRYTDWAKNALLTCEDSDTGTVDADCKYHWLVETEAPEGFQPLAAPVMFKVNADTGATEIVNVSTASVTGTLPLSRVTLNFTPIS